MRAVTLKVPVASSQNCSYWVLGVAPEKKLEASLPTNAENLILSMERRLRV
jgi:hypothetical protein